MASAGTARVSSEDRRQQILDVAMSLFARQGFDGTTTRQIAHGARVNEAIIFRHFPSKEDLYWAIIERKCQGGTRAQLIEECIRNGASDLEVAASIAERMLTRSRADRHLTRLLLFTALERHELSDDLFRNYIAEQYEVLAAYIRRRIRAGAFRSVDPMLAARAFLGMVIYHYQVQELYGGKRHHDYDPAGAGRALAEIWLGGMLAGSGLGETSASSGLSRAARADGAKLPHRPAGANGLTPARSAGHKNGSDSDSRNDGWTRSKRPRRNRKITV